MKYKFDRTYLLNLLKDCKRLRQEELSTEDFVVITTLVKELIYGEFKIQRKEPIPTIDEVKRNLIKIKEELGEENILKLLELSQEFIDNSKYHSNHNTKHLHTKEEIVTDVLNFYEQYDSEEYYQLIKDIFVPSCKLEIVNDNFLTRKLFTDRALTIPYFNLDFIRIIKEDRIYDYAALCHEFRHILDTKKAGSTMINFNILREVNPIYLELYYGILRARENQAYLSGIRGRINFLRECANMVQNSMLIILAMGETNHLNLKMIEASFETEDQKQLNYILTDLNDYSIYDCIVYLIGFLGGIQMCNIALNNKEEAKEISNKVCQILTNPSFIPNNISDYLGDNFLSADNSIQEYKKFIKKI